MTKQAFMNELSDYLENLPQKMEIINDFIEHFEMAREHGETEEQICEALGDPRVIAETFLEEAGQKTSGMHKNRNSGYRDENNYQRSWSRSDDRTDSRSIFELGEISIDESFNVNDTRALIAKIKSCVFEIVGSKNAQAIRVEIKGNSRNNFVVSARDGNLEIIEELGILNRFSFDERMIKDAINYFVNNTRGHSTVKVLVTVPTSYTGMIDISSAAGETRADGVRAENIKITNSAGSVRIYNCEGLLDAYTAAGSIKIEGHTGEIKASSTAGSVKVENANGDIKASSTAGSVKIKNGNGHLDVSSSAGSVSVEAEKIYGLIAKSSAGKIDIDADEILDGGIINASAGSVKLSANKITGNLNLTSSMGSITAYLPRNIDLKIDAENKKRRINYEVFGNDNSQNVLKINASMGSINILAR